MGETSDFIISLPGYLRLKKNLKLKYMCYNVMSSEGPVKQYRVQYDHYLLYRMEAGGLIYQSQSLILNMMDQEV